MKKLLAPSLSAPATVTGTEVQLLCLCIRQALQTHEHTSVPSQPNPSQPNPSQSEKSSPNGLSAEISSQINGLLGQDINWRGLIQIAAAHGVTPLLSKTLITLPSELVSAATLRELKAYFHLKALRNRQQTNELLRLLLVLKNAGIPAIPFKGPVLAMRAYGSLALREFGDLDILVPPSCFVKTRDLLLAHGYERAKQFYGIADIEKQEQDLMHRWGEYPFRHQNGQFEVDLHTRLIGGAFPILSADFDVFLQRLVPMRLLDQSINVFGLEDLLLYLCIHGTKDLWKRLNWVCDVAMLIQHHPQLDWSTVIARAQDLECEQMLWLGVSLAESLMGISLPDIALERRQRHFTQQLFLHQIEAQLLSGISPRQVEYSDIQRVYFHGQLLGNRRDQLSHYLKFCNYILFYRLRPNIHDKTFVALPTKLYALYYLVRPVRVMFDLASSVSKRFKHINLL